MSINVPKNFAARLLKWHREKNVREMPWKGEKDPYKIWLSEIILQQTRVEQGLAYFNRFVKAFPDIHSLASAPEDQVFKLWEGLGYYSRCRNLIYTAKYIDRELGGIFPREYDEIKALKGIGSYTAAAISSFAYNLPYAVVDGNVYRLLARTTGIKKQTDSTEGKKYFATIAGNLLDKKNAGIYNQAIMDFGAVICKPAAPLCASCIFKKDCIAYRQGLVDVLPLKKKKITIKKRWMSYVVIQFDKKTAIRQRTSKDIWKGLYEFPVIESSGEIAREDVIEILLKNKWATRRETAAMEDAGAFKQQLSHQTIYGRFYRLHVSKKMKEDFLWMENLDRFAFPTIIRNLIRTNAFRNTGAQSH
jgi:A/G-specific adenine glycosylase